MMIYDKKWLIGGCIGLVAMCVIMKVTGGAGFVLIFPLIFVAFGKNRTEFLIYLLLLTITITVTNAFLVPKDMVFSISARIVHFLIAGVMVLQVVMQRQSRLTTPFLGLLFYLVYMAIVSSVGWQPMISYLKLILFTTLFLAFYSVANAAANRVGVRLEILRSILLVVSSYFIIGSLLLIPFPGISIMSAAQILASGGIPGDGGLFMGITLHSQALGPVISILSVMLLADLLFRIQRWEKLYLLLLLCSPILIYKTGSRTAMGSWLAGVCFVMFLFMVAKGMNRRWRSHALGILMMIGVLSGIALLSTPQMRAAVVKFTLKYVSDEQAIVVDMDTVLSTRERTMEDQITNFRESPLIGNGFQVSRQLAERSYSSWNQFLSAPVEKGVWVTAILEEGGVLGMLIWVIFVVIVIGTLWTRGAYVGLSIFVTMLICNLGEFWMFSMTSTGGLVWALIFMGVAMDALSLKRRVVQWREHFV